jgi:hypothetical protein
MQVYIDGARAPDGGAVDSWQALRRLAERSVLVVIEDMPAPPETTWAQRLADELPVAVALWAVDTACIVPMNLVTKRYERAFGYRCARILELRT